MLAEKVTVPEFESIFWAFLESGESGGNEIKIDDHFSVSHKFWGRGELWYRDYYNHELFDDFGISIMCCDDEEEYANSSAAIVLERFNKWYERRSHPVDSIADVNCWAQAEPFIMKFNFKEDSVFENCCDYLYYGELFASLIENEHNYGLPEDRTREVWNLAFWFMAEGVSAKDPFVPLRAARYCE